MSMIRIGLCVLLLAAGWSAQASERQWESLGDTDGVEVSRADVEGTKLYAFKGDTVMEAPPGAVLYALLDNQHRIEWVARLVENRVLVQSNEFDYVIYQAFDLPTPFSDRDYVYRGQATEDPETGVVTLAMQSVEHPDAPETVGVRAELVDSRYRLTPIDGGERTRVEVEIVTDPRGMMPAWLVNLIQRSWPSDTLNGLRGELSKSYAGIHRLPGEEETVAEESGEGPSEAPVEEEQAPVNESTEEAAPSDGTEVTK